MGRGEIWERRRPRRHPGPLGFETPGYRSEAKQAESKLLAALASCRYPGNRR